MGQYLRMLSQTKAKPIIAGGRRQKPGGRSKISLGILLEAILHLETSSKSKQPIDFGGIRPIRREGKKFDFTPTLNFCTSPIRRLPLPYLL